MLCEVCNKNPATIHIQEIVNNQKKVLHICAECAAKKSAEDPMLQGFNVAEMLYNLSGQFGLPAQQDPPVEHPAENELECPSCGWKSEDLRKSGKLGCPECYNTFGEVLRNALKNMHRGTMHVGKSPGRKEADGTAGESMELMNLQKELEELVQREEYEKAAVVRDRISVLKESLRSKQGDNCE